MCDISRNRKTGQSLNFDTGTCRPTPWCQSHCYMTRRTKAMIELNGWTSTPNTGPITWPRQQKRYLLNRLSVVAAVADGTIGAMAADLAAKLACDVSRGNGGGDCIPEIVELYCHLAHYGVAMYLYSRKADMIRLMAELCGNMGIPALARPYVLASVDPSTTASDIQELREATWLMNGRPSLALATDDPRIDVDSLPYADDIVVVFGYHAGQTKTRIDDPRACPCSNGDNVVCADCRICYGHHA